MKLYNPQKADYKWTCQPMSLGLTHYLHAIPIVERVAFVIVWSIIAMMVVPVFDVLVF